MGWEASHITGRSAYRFNGLDYFETPADASLNARSEFSYGFMIKPGSNLTCGLAARMNPDANLDLSNSTPPTAAFHIQLIKGHLNVRIWGNDYSSSYTDVTSYHPILHTEEITDIEVTWSSYGNPGDLTIYKNGVTVPYTLNAVAYANRLMPELTGSVMRFGKTSDNRDNFNGIVYDIRYTNRCRSSEEVNNYYESIKPGPAPDNGTGLIVFSSDRRQTGGVRNLYTMDGLGNNQKPFLLRQEQLYYPQWSKHDGGSKVAFCLAKDGLSVSNVYSNGIYTCNANGGDVKKVVLESEPQPPAWSGDGTFMLNSLYTNETVFFEVYKTTNLDATPSSTLYYSSSKQDKGADVAWDNSFMISLKRQLAYENTSEIVKSVINTGTGAITSSSVIFSSNHRIGRIRISPNNQLIGCDARVPVYGGGTHQIFIMDVDGGNIKQLTSIPYDCSFQAFSPDSTKVLFSRVTPSGIWQLHTMDIDGKNMVNISNNSFHDYDADWKA